MDLVPEKRYLIFITIIRALARNQVLSLCLFSLITLYHFVCFKKNLEKSEKKKKKLQKFGKIPKKKRIENSMKKGVVNLFFL